MFRRITVAGRISDGRRAGLGAWDVWIGNAGIGAAHLLQPTWIAALLQLAGAAIGFAPARRFWRTFDSQPFRAPVGRGEWFLLLAAAPVAIAAIAATFPPGSLWQSEGRAYDVLEYHLQMPREYAAGNAIMPVAHNVYSYLPANVEMLYLLLIQTGKFVLSDTSTMAHLWGVFPSQFLHLALLLLTVVGIGLAPVKLGGFGRVVAMLTVLVVPWSLITGSLAYDEWGMMLFGSLALGLALGGKGDGGSAGKCRWEGLLIGTLLGLAVGSKLTAGIAFALPVVLVMLLRGNPRGLIQAILIASVLYLPWAVRTAVASGGNPVFPLAAKLLGRGGWTAEQVQRFEHGHSALQSQQSLAGRMGVLANASLLDEQWSPGWSSIYEWAGEEPPARDLWWKHVGILWVIAPLGILLALMGERSGQAMLLVAVLIAQAMGWMFLTHLQSRFCCPSSCRWRCFLGWGWKAVSVADC